MRKNLWNLILPITFQRFMLALVSASDALMLGKLNQASLSAVSLASQIAFVFNLFMMGLVTGTSMFAAQYWGKKDRENIQNVMGFVLWDTGLISLVFCLGTMAAPDVLMRIFTNDPELVRLGAVYLKVVGISYLLSGVTQIYLCILKNTGYAGKSMLISSATVVLNLLLNAVLIYGLGGASALGITGAALATVLANAAGLVWAVLESFGKDGLRPAKAYLGLRVSELEKRFWKYTAPVMANGMFWGCGFTMYSVVMGHLGTDAVAANSVANIAKNLVVCFCLGLGNAGSILVGNALGAGDLNRAKKEGAYLCRLSVVSGILTGAFLLAISPVILSFVQISPQARAYLKYM
ncbi:MAG: MATE family efflux transporter, partial [Lachnospiraceae bacterium]|nr:MATE family efflux transporter [Lachnospiraceae bacterium]